MRTSRANCTTAMMNEPKATEPRWYLQHTDNRKIGGLAKVEIYVVTVPEFHLLCLLR